MNYQKPIAFTYVLFWEKQQRTYYGVKYSKGCKPSDVGTVYFSSSKIVKQFWKEHGDPLIIIDQQFLSADEAREYEAEILQENDVRNNLNWLNKVDGMAPFAQSGSKHHMFGKPSPMRNRKHSDESKAKMKAARKGRIYSEQTREKLRLANMNKTHSDESKAKMSAARMGMILSEQTKAKISAAFKGNNHPRYLSAVKVFEHIDGEVFIGTEYELYTSKKIDQGSISRLVNGKRKTAKGWRYIGLHAD